MEDPKESSPAPSTRIKRVLNKGRRGKRDESVTPSISIHDTSSEALSASGIRTSIDSSSGDKLRFSRQSSLQSSLDDGSGAKKLAKLVPGHKKRVKKRQEAAEQQLAEETNGQRGRSISDQTATAADVNLGPGNLSRTTLDDGESSLITVDSDRSVS